MMLFTYRTFGRSGAGSRSPLPGAVAAVLIAFLLAGLFAAGFIVLMVVAPILLAAYFYGRWRMRRVLRDLAQSRRAPGGGRVIDADYRVLDSKD